MMILANFYEDCKYTNGQLISGKFKLANAFNITISELMQKLENELPKNFNLEE